MPLRHIAGSGGLLQLPEAHLDMVRPGVLSYGVYPTPPLRSILAVQPVMRLRSEVVFFKVVKKGATVGYDRTWIAPRDTRIVTVPIGYGDGYSRALSNCGEVLIRGKRYPIVGLVCMDQIMVDIGDDEAYVGDEVVLIGSQGDDEISVGELAGLIGTNTHEVLVSTNMRVPRCYHLGGVTTFE